MLSPPLRICYVRLYFCLLADYSRLADEITCIQNNLPFAIKCFGYASSFFRVLCLNGNLFSQCFLYYNSIFHIVLTLLCCQFYVMGGRVYVMHAKLRAKVLLFFDICKLFLHIARNQHEIAENIYKEDRKNCYAGSSFQFVRRALHFSIWYTRVPKSYFSLSFFCFFSLSSRMVLQMFGLSK